MSTTIDNSTTLNLRDSTVINSKKTNIEILTPYKLTVTILLKCYCQFKVSDEWDEISLLVKVQIRKSFSVLAQQILQGPDMNLGELYYLYNSSFKILLPIFNKFEEELIQLYCNGISHLMNIIDEIKEVLNGISSCEIVEKKLITKNSIIGFFLRRFIVFFEKFTFTEVSNLYQVFKNFYQNYKKSLQTNVESKIDEWYITETQWSRKQAELFLATQAILLQNNEEKALSPQELHKKITNILKSNPDLPEAHFLSYLNYLRVEEFCGAMQSLFHCFDCRSNSDLKLYSDEISKECRYGALNLAILHHHFGHTREALTSIKEAIRISHKTNDNLCLQHALSWLYRLSNVNKDNLIVQCIIQTFEHNVSYTTSLALQNFAHYGSAKTSVKPSVIFETLTKSDMLNCQHNYKDLIFNNNALKSSLWRLYGKTEMWSLWAQILLYLNIDALTITVPYYGEGYLKAICNVALRLSLEGEYNLVNVIIQYVKSKFPYGTLAESWMLVENWHNFTRALYKENWQDAESAAQKILVFDKWEGYLKLAELYYYQQEYEQANKCLSFILENYSNDEHLNDGKFCLLRAKILHAQIHFSSNFPNVSSTLLSFCSCLIEAEKSELAYLISIIHLHIANVLLILGLKTQAIKVLTNPRCMIEILTNGGVYDRARANLLYIKCLIANSSKNDAKIRADIILKAAQLLKKVQQDFMKAEATFRAKDVLYFQAQLFNTLNMRSERNQCAFEHRLLDEESPTKNKEMLIKYL